MDDQTKEITKLIWSLGDYEEIAKTSLPAAIHASLIIAGVLPQTLTLEGGTVRCYGFT
jgi:hypothetical protein